MNYNVWNYPGKDRPPLPEITEAVLKADPKASHFAIYNDDEVAKVRYIAIPLLENGYADNATARRILTQDGEWPGEVYYIGPKGAARINS